MIRSRLIASLLLFAFAAGCGSETASNNAGGNKNQNTSSDPQRATITIAERPQSIKDQMAARGEQDQAAPTLTIVEPKEGSTINSSTVKVKLTLSGDLKGYKPHMDDATKMGNHVHVILDNAPYEAYYNLDREFELRNVADGEHTLRVFPSRPWHESYKNEGAFQMVKFTVRNGGGDPAKPTTTSGGSTMADPTPEARSIPSTMAGPVDPSKPLLTYSRPKGIYTAADAAAIMIDFWLSNAKLVGDGGEYRVRYSVNGGEVKFIDKWEPIWLSGWASGSNTVKLELVDKDGNIVDNGGYNSTTREIIVGL